MNFKHLTAFLCLFLFSAGIIAQTHTAKTNVTTCSMSNGYYEYLPQGYWNNPGETFPMIIFIAGAAECGNGSPEQIGRVLMHGPASFITAGTWPGSFTVNNQTYKPIVITPQFINQPGASVFNDFLNYMVAHYKVDINRVYISGYSMGGAVCWSYCGSNATYAGRIAGIVPGAGSYSPNAAMANTMAASNLPVLAIQNNPDPAVPTQWSIDWVNMINAAPAPPNPLAKMILFNIYGHDLTHGWEPNMNANNQYNFTGRNVWEWMLGNRRFFTTLPVHFTSFSASKQNSTAVLNWQTANETNNQGFEVQRSANGQSWQTLIFIRSNGISGNYAYTDPTPLAGKSFYRIKQSDLNGNSRYSETRFIDFSKQGYLYVYPNPVPSVLTLYTDMEIKNGRVRIFDGAGRLLLSLGINGAGSIQIPVSNLPKGSYVVQTITDMLDKKLRFIKE
ncbi:MAG: T9SS type A sorting domain-containing protein [Ferruginibacter sp.]